jgi:hypothetical protein
MTAMKKLMDPMIDDNPVKCREKNKRSTDEELTNDSGT